VLIIVLWVSFGLITLALYFGQSSSYDLRASDNRVASIEAGMTVDAAARYMMYVFTNQTTNGVFPDPTTFQYQEVAVGDGKYWLIGRGTNDTGPQDKLYCGLVDEASKLNLNYPNFTNAYWTNLPNMTPELAAAIYDWSHTNTTPSQGGAKDETYNALSPAYLCKQGPFETVEELRLVSGMTSDLLYGEDANLNGILDPNENDGDVSPPSDNHDSHLDPGFMEYFTVFSREPNTIAPDGSTLVNVTNQSGLTGVLNQYLSSGRGALIVRALFPPQQGTGRGGTPGRPGGPAPTPPPVTFSSMMDFYVKATAAGMTIDEFTQVAPYLTTSTGTYRYGRININTASLAVLSCIPGIGASNAQSVVSYRQSNAGNLQTIAWLYEALGENRAAATQAGPYITTQSYQFSVDVAAVGHLGRGYRRVRFVIDTSESTTNGIYARIVYRRDLTHLGWALGKEVRQNLTMLKENP
jgi:hypothetical protein